MYQNRYSMFGREPPRLSISQKFSEREKRETTIPFASIDLYLFIWHHRIKYLIENFYNKETGNQAIKYDAHYIYIFWLYHLGEATSQMNSQKIIKIKRVFFLKKIIKEKRCCSRASEPNGKLRRKTINFINVEL